jgi:uncharacterized membrane protein
MEASVRRSDVVLALLSYLPVLFLVPLLFRRRSRFVVYHSRQGLYLFTVWLALMLVFVGLFTLFTVALDWEQSNLFVVTLAVLTTLTLAGYVLAVIWMEVTVLQKRMVMLPVLGDLAGER